MGNTLQPHIYAQFREDKPADSGHTRELMYHFISYTYSCHTNKETPDQFGPLEPDGCKTIIDVFDMQAKKHADRKFLGTRNQSKEGKPYEWKNYRQVSQLKDDLSRGTCQNSLI